MVIDETGGRKDGTKTAHVARQYLGSIGKTDNGIVAVSSLWTDPSVYYPLHVAPYTPASRLPQGKADPAFRTKPPIAVEQVDAALAASVPVRAIVADCLYGENPTFERALSEAGLPFVVGWRPSKSVWAPIDSAHTPKEAIDAIVNAVIERGYGLCGGMAFGALVLQRDMLLLTFSKPFERALAMGGVRGGFALALVGEPGQSVAESKTGKGRTVRRSKHTSARLRPLGAEARFSWSGGAFTAIRTTGEAALGRWKAPLSRSADVGGERGSGGPG